MTFVEIFYITIANVLVTILVTSFVRWALTRAVFELKETKAELQKLRTMYGNADLRLTEMTKKNAALEMILTRAMEPRLRAVEKAVSLNQNGTQS